MAELDVAGEFSGRRVFGRLSARTPLLLLLPAAAHAAQPTLTVISDPPGLHFTLDDQAELHTAPAHDMRVSAGVHFVRLREKCLDPRTIEVKASGRSEVRLAGTLHTVPLTVTLRDRERKIVPAAVLADDARLGNTGVTLQLPVCAQSLQVQATGVDWRTELHLPQEQMATVAIELIDTLGRVRALRNSLGKTWRAQPPAQVGTLDWARLRCAVPLEGPHGNLRSPRDAERRTILTLEGMLEHNPRRWDQDVDLFFRLGQAEDAVGQDEWTLRCLDWQKARGSRPEPEPPLEHGTTRLDWYLKVVQRAPDYPRMDEVMFRLGRGWLLWARESDDPSAFQAGRDWLERMVRKYPESKFAALAHLHLAEALVQAGQLVDARKHYQAIPQASPEANYAAYKLAWLEFRLGDRAKAWTMLEKLGSDPLLKDAVAQDLLAMAAAR
jgi:hypothetical protein